MWCRADSVIYIRCAWRHYLTMLIWKSASWRVFHDPDKKSLHQKKALVLVSRSTSSVLPLRKDSASESSSPWAAPSRGLGLLEFLSFRRKTFPTRFFSAGVPGTTSEGWVDVSLPLCCLGPGSCSLLGSSSPWRSPRVTVLPDCIVSFRAKTRGTPEENVCPRRKGGLADTRTSPVKLLNRKSQT